MKIGDAIYNLIKIQGESTRRTRFTQNELYRADKSFACLIANNVITKEEEDCIRNLMELCAR